jgi:hypothetical protein
MHLDAIHLLRHGLATVAYRGGKVLRDVPTGFGGYAAGPGTRTAAEILAHVGDLYDWAATMVRGEVKWVDSPERDWDALVHRFFASIASVDALLQETPVTTETAEMLLRGPVADSLTHIGQLALMRRLAGGPVRAENYARAHIQTGRVGRDQAPPVREF